MGTKLRRVRIAVYVTTAVLVLAAIPAAFAAKGGKNNGGASANSPGLVMVADSNANGLANYGDTVTFDVSSAPTSYPTVALACYQGGSKVFWASASFYDSGLPAWMRNFTLSSSHWTGGAADCTAALTDSSSGRTQILGSLDFHVDP
jgi:hypothetical protein